MIFKGLSVWKVKKIKSAVQQGLVYFLEHLEARFSKDEGFQITSSQCPSESA